MSAINRGSIATMIGIAPAFHSMAVSVSTNKLQSRTWSDCEREMDALKKYLDDWDGMGASAIDPRSVVAARGFLDTLRTRQDQVPPSAVTGTPDGHVMVQWTLGDAYLEAEFIGDGEIEWMEEKNGRTMEWSEPIRGSEAVLSPGVEGRAWRSTIANSAAAVFDPFTATPEPIADTSGNASR